MAVGLKVMCIDNILQMQQGNEPTATYFTIRNPFTKLKVGSFLAAEADISSHLPLGFHEAPSCYFLRTSRVLH
jgi:hypothetical protein